MSEWKLEIRMYVCNTYIYSMYYAYIMYYIYIYVHILYIIYTYMYINHWGVYINHVLHLISQHLFLETKKKTLGKLQVYSKITHHCLGPIHWDSLISWCPALPRHNMSVPKSNSMYVVCRIIWLQNLIGSMFRRVGLDDSSRWVCFFGDPETLERHLKPYTTNDTCWGEEETKQKGSKTSLEIFCHKILDVFCHQQWDSGRCVTFVPTWGIPN